MKKDLITLETAKIAKEKGFNIPSIYKYAKDIEGTLVLGTAVRKQQINWNDHNQISVPTQALLQKWLRENHEIDVLPHREGIGSDEFVYAYTIFHEEGNDKKLYNRLKHINSFSDYGGTYVGGWDKYETALEEGLLWALTLIKT